MNARRDRLIRVIAAQQAARRQAEAHIAALHLERDAVARRQVELIAARENAGPWRSMLVAVGRCLVELSAASARLDQEIEIAKAARNAADLRERTAGRIADRLAVTVRNAEQRKLLEEVGSDHARSSASGKSGAPRMPSAGGRDDRFDHR